MGNFNIRLALAATAFALTAAGCVTAPRETAAPDPHFKVGKPYKINGRWYRPAVDSAYDKRGVASWYGDQFHGRPTANGEIFNMREMTAAHTTLPLPSLVEVTNLENGRKTVVRVNARGPFAKNRIIDLSRAAARRLGFEKQGLAKVRVRYLSPAPLPGEETEPKFAAATPAIQPITVAASAPAETMSTDELANLLGNVDPGRAPVLPQPLQGDATPAETLFAIQVAILDDIGQLPALRAQLENEGPLRIARLGSAAESARYRINLGPFPSETAAADRLENIREAGYGDAVVVAISPQ